MTWERLTDWFGEEVGEPWPFQERVWEARREGRSGLIHVPTGAGKTYAAYLPALERAAEGYERGLRVLYLAPLRAMTRDLSKALEHPVDDLDLNVTVESRTGDTSRKVRRRQRSSLPNVLLTTPESLSLLLTYSNARQLFGGVQTVIVDEWHELISSKRGTQVELGLARLRRWNPELRTWALSATLDNLEEAADAACGPDADPLIVDSELERPIEIETRPPPEVDTFPWFGHLGMEMLPRVLEVVDEAETAIVFANTRSQAERWYREILDARPDLAGRMGLHHGSVDRKEREFVEDALKSGDFEVVVSTSSLDLGVDFSTVDRVVQIGSIKGISRMIQRAGRSGHQPGETCRITCVPTNALELMEFAAARDAVDRRDLEPRRPPSKPLDVLAQHLVTCALGGGFEAEPMLEELRSAYAYRELTDEEFEGALELVTKGGESLETNDFYHRVDRVDGRYTVENRRKARQHRMCIGTITSDPAVQVKYTNNHRLGSVEESFISRIKPGDRFVFAGKVVELVRVREMVAYVKKAQGTPSHVPRWLGGRLPISRSLSDALRRSFETANDDDRQGPPELEMAAPILQTQRELSELPGADELLVETFSSDEGRHLYLYPFEGRLAHEGLATLLAYRLSRGIDVTFGLSANAYGIELLAPESFDFRERLDAEILSPESFDEDVREAVNVAELAKRRFRSVARVAGLVFEGYPGSRKSSKQLQNSSSLLYRVFRKWEPDHLLLRQARREVLERHFERSRLVDTLDRLSNSTMLWHEVARPTPLGFPLLVERVGAQLSTESLRQRIERMKEQWTTA
jgi:ATP-dependent Lhr-like helicase